LKLRFCVLIILLDLFCGGTLMLLLVLVCFMLLSDDRWWMVNLSSLIRDKCRFVRILCLASSYIIYAIWVILCKEMKVKLTL
jgi:hypothetical protein